MLHADCYCPDILLLLLLSLFHYQSALPTRLTLKAVLTGLGLVLYYHAAVVIASAVKPATFRGE
jgi:hypothetical protein